ncbi:MAG: hypothetical protein JRH11_15515 [Deltaproteobacteria bacterium]|nr:hypothetical protein [Deltaproteobacteria bacterium]
MNKIFWLSLVAVLATSTSGCMFDWDDWDEDYGYYEEDRYISPAYDPAYDTGATVDLEAGYMAGDLGDYRGFTAPAYQATEQDWGDSSTVELHGGDDYWVMTRLEVTGGLKHRDLVPGAVLEFEFDDYGWAEGSADSGVFISSIGCSGPTHGNYTYDGPADRVTVEVEAGPTANDRVLHFQAEYQNGGETQLVEGSFGYTVY